MARTKTLAVPEVGGDAPEFNLPSAQGGQLRLSMRTARGPVIVVFYADGGEEDVRYFSELAGREDEINMAGGTIVAIGVSGPDEARAFARETGLKSYVLYDYTRTATGDYGLLERDRKHGYRARPAAFVIGGDHKVVQAWVGELPKPDDLLAKISEITGLPKPAEEAEGEGADEGAAKTPKKAPEKAPEEGAESGGEEAAGAEKPKKMSAEERERIKAERRAARAAGKSVKQPPSSGSAAEGEAAGGPASEGPKKMTAEERERIKAERRAARAEGRSLKQPADKPSGGDGAGGEAAEAPERKRLSPEEREQRRAERRAAREAGGTPKPEAGGEGDGAKAEEEG